MGTVKRTFQKDVEAVFAKLTDPDHLRRRAEAAGHRNVEVQVDERQDGFDVRVARDIESDIPAFAKKVVDPVNHVVDQLKWRSDGDGKRATYDVKVSSRISIRGEITLRPVSGGSEYVDSFTAKVDVPIVGKKIAGIVEKETDAAIRADLDRAARELS